MVEPTSPIKQPNLYELSGSGIQISYSTSSFDGRPHFNYHDVHQNKLFTGDQIHVTQSELGMLVSVVLLQVIDAGSTTFTLLVPQVSLRHSEGTNITTIGITTLHKSSIIGPPHGQSDLYTVYQLQGTAVLVFF